MRIRPIRLIESIRSAFNSQSFISYWYGCPIYDQVIEMFRFDQMDDNEHMLIYNLKYVDTHERN